MDDTRSGVDRRGFLKAGALTSAAAALAARAQAAAAKAGAFALEEATVADLGRWMETGAATSQALTAAYLERIDALDRRGPTLRAVLETNPDALRIAAELDAERKAKGPRGPLHGIPVLVKDNIDTADRMRTSAGSLALAEGAPAHDAAVVTRLRAAGAVILGKTNLSEWANIRSTHSTSGWSGRGGLTRNPYALDRNASGSSSGTGVAVAASLCAIGVGTETDGSIVSPSSASGLVGVKPTVGLVSRTGIIPISVSQDTAGPMARTVADAALLLGALAGVDPADAATSSSARRAETDYTRFLDTGSLRGARIGVARKLAGFLPAVDRLFDAALADLKRLGAEIVDPTEIPHAADYNDSELEVLLYELKDGLNAYLAGRGPGVSVKTLADVIAFNEREAAREMPYFGQELFLQAQEKGPLTSPEYREALEKGFRLSRAEGLDAVLDAHKLDAVVAPTGSPAWMTDLVDGDHYVGGGISSPPAVAGYPHVTVPMGHVFGLPVGLSFVGRAWSEGRLLGLAFAFEQATKHRQPPRYLPTANLG